MTMHEQTGAREPRGPSRRGHGAKIEEAVRVLWAAGEFPPYLRKVEQRRRVEKWLVAHGYGLDMPKRCALEHHIPIIVRDLVSSAKQIRQKRHSCSEQINPSSQ